MWVSTLGHLCDPTELLTLSQLNRSTDHDYQDRANVLKSRVAALLKPIHEILSIAEHPRERANGSGHG